MSCAKITQELRFESPLVCTKFDRSHLLQFATSPILRKRLLFLFGGLQGQACDTRVFLVKKGNQLTKKEPGRCPVLSRKDLQTPVARSVPRMVSFVHFHFGAPQRLNFQKCSKHVVFLPF